MSSYNRMSIIGNVGKDPEMRFTPSGKPVTSFSVAVTNRFKKDGETQEETSWFNVVAWNKLAENCNQFLGKGAKVFAEGRLSVREWEDQAGTKRCQVEIIASNVLFLNPPKEQQDK